MNGAKIEPLKGGAGHLVFDEDDKDLRFSVIDGQHRINGAYFAVCILRKKQSDVKWEFSLEIFIDLGQSWRAPKTLSRDLY